MARLRWLIRMCFWVPTQSFRYLKKKIFRGIFLFYHEIAYCVCSLESPHQCNSNEYTRYTITGYKIERISLNHRYLLPGLAAWLILSGSNYPYLELISTVPKMFEPLKFACIVKWSDVKSWSELISSPRGFEPRTSWLTVGSANHSVTRRSLLKECQAKEQLVLHMIQVGQGSNVLPSTLPVKGRFDCVFRREIAGHPSPLPISLQHRIYKDSVL